LKLKPEVQKEIRVKQEKQLKRLMKLLSGSDRKALTKFLQSGQAPGSKAYKSLKPNLQRGVLKLNITSIEIMINHARNPFSKFRFKMAKFSYEKMLKVTDK
jgi:hypothetical protein